MRFCKHAKAASGAVEGVEVMQARALTTEEADLSISGFLSVTKSQLADLRALKTAAGARTLVYELAGRELCFAVAGNETCSTCC